MPLINIVFLLLIFFMVAGQLTKHDAVPVEPPVSASGEDAANPTVGVFVAADGAVHLNGRVVGLDLVATEAARLLKNGAVRSVDVKADGAADAGIVISVMHGLRAAGAERVRLVTARRSPS